MQESGPSDILLVAHQGLRSVWSRLRLLPSPSPPGYFYIQWTPEALPGSKDRTEIQIWRELATTEHAYIAKLRLAASWAAHLKLGSVQYPHLSSAFLACQELCVLHQQMVEKMKVATAENGKISNNGNSDASNSNNKPLSQSSDFINVLSMLRDNLTKYEKYVSIFYNAAEEFSQARKEIAEQASYMSAQKEIGVELEIALMSPLQRISAYMMQLQELQRATSRYSSEHTAIRVTTGVLVPLTKQIVLKIKSEIQRLSSASLLRMHTPRGSLRSTSSRPASPTAASSSFNSPSSSDAESEMRRLHARIRELEAEVDGLRRKLQASSVLLKSAGSDADGEEEDEHHRRNNTNHHKPPNLPPLSTSPSSKKIEDDTKTITPSRRKLRKPTILASHNGLPSLPIESPTGAVYKTNSPSAHNTSSSSSSSTTSSCYSGPVSILDTLQASKGDDVVIPEAKVSFIPPRRSSLSMGISLRAMFLIHQKFRRILGKIRSREQVLKRVKIAIDMKEERDTTMQRGIEVGLMMLEQEKKKEALQQSSGDANNENSSSNNNSSTASGVFDTSSLLGAPIDAEWEPHVYGEWSAVWDSATGNVFFRKLDLSAQTWDCPSEILDKLEGEDKWAMLVEPASGLVYFHNRQQPQSGTTWMCPEELRKQPIGKKKQMRLFQQCLREVQKVISSTFVVGFADVSPDDIMKLDHELIKKMCIYFQTKTLSGPSACQMLVRAFPLLLNEDNVVFLNRDNTQGSRVIVVGDIHGQLGDLEIIIEKFGFPSQQNKYVFNGDIVDRGPHSVECLFIMLSLKILAPDCVIINRGNHEARNMNMVGGFWEEVCQRYDAPFFNLFSEFMGCLPMCTVIDKRIFVVHAGLFKKDSVTLDQILAFRRFHNEPPPGSLLEDMLWSDPMGAPGRKESQRGAGCRFGPDVCERFLADNRLEMVIRSHEVCDNGWEEVFPNRLFTVFSASNYCDEVGNKGAVAIISGSGTPDFVEYSTLEGAECHPELWSPASMIPSSPQSIPGSPLSLGGSRSPSSQMMGKKLHDNIFDKLKARIAFNRNRLLKEFDAIAEASSSSDLSDSDEEEEKKKRKRPTKKGSTIHRLIWADILKQVLELDIPWLQMQQELVGHTRPMIDYAQWLDVFKIKHRTFNASSHEKHNEQAQELMAEVGALLFHNKMHMTYLFKYLDQDGDGQVSRAEFQSGITSLLSLIHVQRSYDDALISDMMDLIDTDSSGSIDYEEFFAGFKPRTDAELTTVDHDWIETDISSLLKNKKK